VIFINSITCNRNVRLNIEQCTNLKKKKILNERVFENIYLDLA